MLKNKYFEPKIFSTLKDYNASLFLKDLFAGIIVGIVALPLAIAFGVASGVTPEAGIVTAIIAGFIISLLGGSRVQIGGPTGAFIVIVYGIIQQYGFSGLIISTIMAGLILVSMGLLKIGDYLKFIPAPVITGFTSGIALVIFSTQVKDFFGLPIETLPVDFFEKWYLFADHIGEINIYALFTAILTIVIIWGVGKVSSKIPSTFIALVITTGLATIFEFPIETIGSKFGDISASIPLPVVPDLSLNLIRGLIAPAFTIALLGAIESLLSAVVSDSMIGGKHRSNTELIAQGIANIVTPFFGGLPATGAIARTATNVKNGGRTPVSGVIHAITLLLILLYLSSLAGMIPMATLAGILVVVSYNMSQWREFKSMLHAPRSDVAILLITFFLTVIFDLTIAVEVGLVLSAFLFVKRMSEVSGIELYEPINKKDVSRGDIDSYYSRANALSNLELPSNTVVYEISGAFFFGAVNEFDKIIRKSFKDKKNIILRMNNVPTLDATGLDTLSKLYQDSAKNECKLIIAELNPHCMKIIKKAGFYNLISQDIFLTIEDALKAIISSEFAKEYK